MFAPYKTVHERTSSTGWTFRSTRGELREDEGHVDSKVNRGILVSLNDRGCRPCQVWAREVFVSRRRPEEILKG